MTWQLLPIEPRISVDRQALVYPPARAGVGACDHWYRAHDEPVRNQRTSSQRAHSVRARDTHASRRRRHGDGRQPKHLPRRRCRLGFGVAARYACSGATHVGAGGGHRLLTASAAAGSGAGGGCSRCGGYSGSNDLGVPTDIVRIVHGCFRFSRPIARSDSGHGSGVRPRIRR